jgi:hypothetical protein
MADATDLKYAAIPRSKVSLPSYCHFSEYPGPRSGSRYIGNRSPRDCVGGGMLAMLLGAFIALWRFLFLSRLVLPCTPRFSISYTCKIILWSAALPILLSTLASTNPHALFGKHSMTSSIRSMCFGYSGSSMPDILSLASLALDWLAVHVALKSFLIARWQMIRSACHRHFMALVKCPECQNAVSTTAPTGPKCGAPIKRQSQFSPLRILLILIGIEGSFLSFVYGSMFGIIVSVIFILLAAIAK